MPDSLFADLQGRVALVTGGARGLGFEMADALAAQGARLALLDRLDATEGAQRLSDRYGGDALAVVVDVTDPTSVGAAFNRVDVMLGTPGVLVNAAGISIWADAEEMSLTEWQRLLNVNLTGTFLTCQAFAQAVLATEGTGTIVNVSSMSAFVVNTPQHQVGYNTTKAGVDQLTRSLAVEWIGRGIRVNAISPGYFLSEMTRQYVAANPDLGADWVSRIPAGRMGDPADLRGLVTFLASDASRYVVGESVVIDGGYSIV